MLDENWLKTKKKIDRKFKGSIHDQMGFEKYLCPRCKTHLWKGICLNACHLTQSSRQRFASLINGATQQITALDASPRGAQSDSNQGLRQ